MDISCTDEIQTSRQDVLAKFVLTLSTLLDLYQNAQRPCPQRSDCDATALGKFIQGLTTAGLFPVPDPSSLDRSIEKLFSTVRAIKLSPLCGVSTRRLRMYPFAGYEGSSQACHLDELLQDSLLSIEDSLQGMNINGGGRKENL